MVLETMHLLPTYIQCVILPRSLRSYSEMLIVVKTRRQYEHWLAYIQAQNPNLLAPEEPTNTKKSPPHPL